MKVSELENHSIQNWFYDMGDQLKEFIYKRAEGLFVTGDQNRDKINDIQGVEKRKEYIRQKFIESIGGLPDFVDSTNSNIIGTVQCEGFRIEKVTFESRPNTVVTSNLYIPDALSKPCGAVLFLCGHLTEAKHSEKYQRICRYLVNAGLIVLALDPIGQGERFSYYDVTTGSMPVNCGSAEHDYVGSQCWPLGDSIARYFLHDAIRGIDYLCTRPEVDPERIGVTGNSGGGAQTCMLMLYDQRIAAAAPATFLTDMKAYMRTGIAQDAEQIWPGFVGAGLGHEDILISMVPRPVLVLGAKYDYFPIEGTRKSINRAKRFWEMYDKENCLELFEDESDHDYTEKMAVKAEEFFSEHLLRRQITPLDVMARPLESRVLLCTKTGQVNGDMIGARHVFDENCEHAIDLHRLRKKLNEKQQKDIAIRWLKNKIYNNRKMCDLNPRIFFIDQVDELLVWDCLWWTQEGLFNHGILIKNSHFTAEEMPVTIAIWEGGTRQLKSQMKWIGKECEQARAVLVLDVSGVGYVKPNPINSYYHESDFGGAIAKLAYDLFWMDDSIAAMRTFDVIRAVDAVSNLPLLEIDGIKVYGCGRYGIYAQLAALLDMRIKSLEVVESVESFEKMVLSRYYDAQDIMSIIIPGILKYFDMPDINRWLKEIKSV